MFTDPDDRQSEELMQELLARALGGDPSFGQKIRLVDRTRSYEEQKALRERYLAGKNINYDMPGSERHDA